MDLSSGSPQATAARAQARMPLRHSGMVTPSVEEIAPFAFWGAIANASYALFRAFPDGNLPPRLAAAIRTARTTIAQRLPADELDNLAPPATATEKEMLEFYGKPETRVRAEHLQRRMLHGALQREANATLRAAPPLIAARLLATKAKWAHAWLSCPLGDSILMDEAQAMAVRLRLGLPPSAQMPQRCWCGKPLAADPWHPLSHSPGDAEAIHGHNEIAKVIADAVERAGGRAWLEPRFQLPGPDDQHTDIRVALGPRLFYVDVSVVHPTAQSYLNASSRRELATAAVMP